MSTPEKTTATFGAAARGAPAADRRAGGATAVLDAPVAGATDVVEAATTEAAIAEVHQRLGPDARILDARRVLRGGVGGFFAKEHVQLHVAPGVAPAASRRAPASRTGSAAGANEIGPSAAAVASDPERSAASTAPPRVARPTGFNPWAQVAAEEANVLSPVDRLLAQADEVPDEGPSAIDFATFLRDQLGPDVGVDSGGPRVDAAASGGGLPADDELARPAWPRIDVDSARLVGGTAVRLDADGEVTDPVPETTPASLPATSAPDLLHREPAPAQDGGPAWSVTALLALGLPVELVRSLEVDDPHDDIAWTMALAEALRPSCRPLPDGPAVFVGPCADGFAHVDDAPVARSETWLAALRPGRWVHLVVGGEGWRRGLDESPLAASWAEPDDLPDAIRCAVELGLVLGYGPTGAAMGRARPLDVALAVRDLVVNR